MKNFKKIVYILISMMIFLQIYIYVTHKKENKSLKPIVSVTTFALYDISEHIAHGSIDIINILPFGVDPHDFEPTPKLMTDIEKSSLVFYSGAGLEPWTHGFVFKNRAIDVSKYVKLREVDPHYWLDFDNMKKTTEIVTDEFIKLNPKYTKMYKKNRDKYIAMLNLLDEKYTKTLLSCKKDTVVLDHNAMGYLSAKYGFNVESLSGLSPEAEPTISDIKRIINDIKRKGIGTIFFENFVNSKTIKSIAKDENITLEVFQALGNITSDEEKKHSTYNSLMLENLKKLSKALECK